EGRGWRPRSLGSRSTRSAKRPRRFTTDHGRNGDRATISRSNRKLESMARSKAPVAFPRPRSAGHATNDLYGTGPWPGLTRPSILFPKTFRQATSQKMMDPRVKPAGDDVVRGNFEECLSPSTLFWPEQRG